MTSGDIAESRCTLSRRASYVLVATVFIASWGQSWCFNHHFGLATIFFGPGVILATLYCLDQPARGRILAVMSLAQIAGLLAAGVPLGPAVISALIAAGQEWIGASVLRVLAPRRLDFTKASAFAKLALVAFLVAPPSGLALQLLLSYAYPLLVSLDLANAGHSQHVLGSGIFTGWIFPHALGILLAVPLVIGFCTSARRQQVAWLSRERWAIMLFAGVATAGIFYSNGHAYLFLICPPLVLAGLRLGVRDTASAILISLTIASVATASGNGPAEVLQTAFGLRTVFLELAYLCACGCIMPIAASLESRRHLEAELARNLDFSEQILGNMHEIVFRTDVHGRWTFLNSAWERITGYTIAESLGHEIFELIRAEDLVERASAHEALMRGEVDDLNLQRRLIARDGVVREIEVSVRALHNPDGSMLGSTGIIRDVSDNRRYVEDLKKSERRFRQLCDTAPIGIVRCDSAGIITYANQKLQAIFLTHHAKLVDLPCLDALGIDSPGLAQQLSSALDAPGAVFEEELGFRDNAGAHRWLIFTATGEFDADAQLSGYIAAVNDITERKAVETELASKTSELRLLAENVSDVVFRLGMDGICRYVTPSVREMTGADPQELIGTSHCFVTHPDDKQKVAETFLQLAQGAIRHCTMTYRVLPEFPEADYIWVEANCRLLRDASGQPYEVLSVVRDITERKQLEMAISEARHRAEAATLAKSAFIANLSHEIRTPMNGVIGLTELLLDRDLDEPSRRYAKLISESGAAMMQLLNDILDISKIDSGRLQLSNEEFDLHRCMANALSLMTASAGSKKLELRLETAPGLPRMMLGDSHRLRQVLTNLIGNAVKFTESGHVLVGARIDGAVLEIRVEDTGIGIAEEQQGNVFKEFVQANPEISSGYGGTGLGLSISRRIAEAMAGTLTLTSQPGKGTTMFVRIPARFVAEQRTLANVTVAANTATPTAPLRILVAEDNRTNQIIINGMLMRLGHSAAIAQDGEEVIAMAQQAAAAGQPFDVVLMDIQMPKLDGIEATNRLRAMGFDAERLPIIALTANAYREDTEACLAAGMQDHLTKPVRLSDLKDALDALGLGDVTHDIAGSEPERSPQKPVQSEFTNDT